MKTLNSPQTLAPNTAASRKLTRRGFASGLLLALAAPMALAVLPAAAQEEIRDIRGMEEIDAFLATFQSEVESKLEKYLRLDLSEDLRQETRRLFDELKSASDTGIRKLVRQVRSGTAAGEMRLSAADVREMDAALERMSVHIVQTTPAAESLFTALIPLILSLFRGGRLGSIIRSRPRLSPEQRERIRTLAALRLRTWSEMEAAARRNHPDRGA